MIILCAKEHQPPVERFPGTKIVHAPNDDDFTRLPTREELLIAIQAARLAVPVLENGGKVLSTCWMGWNRSGLVSAITLHLWLGVDGRKAIQMVREGRRKALKNPGFLSVLEKLPG
jgi:protein-tyrosine phosphatase